jgi:hypothetical protein
MSIAAPGRGAVPGGACETAVAGLAACLKSSGAKDFPDCSGDGAAKSVTAARSFGDC